MMKHLLAAAAVATLAISTPALAQVEQHQNASLNGYVGHATSAQYAGPTAFGTASEAGQLEAVGSGNPSLEAFNPNAVNPRDTRFNTAPNVAEHADFDWIDQADVGA